MTVPEVRAGIRATAFSPRTVSRDSCGDEAYPIGVSGRTASGRPGEPA